MVLLQNRNTQTRRPLAPRRGHARGQDGVDRPAGQTAGGQAQPGGGWGCSSPDPVVLRGSAWAGPLSRPSRVAAALCLFGFAKRRVHPRCSINKNQQSIPAGPAGRQGPQPSAPSAALARTGHRTGQRISAAGLTPPCPKEPPTQASL
ncbi:hypothetical protein P7K49_002169 [Saguinus oedipus]|uniref:Uncharacterized protein n=1 Tax=Saguinus oedipus TaxID=9490 RepID=A0ABQ9WGM4_SAGOE|nr:hypothetical protein P7K49_002169 [Saguinus oedipus]